MLEAHALRRTALVLVTIGLLWNLVEAVVAFWAGFQASSIAILAFGLDSIVELFAGGVLVWRLTTHLGDEEAEAAEQRAQRLVGFTFFLLAFYILLHSGANLAGWLPEPQPSIAGVAIVVASAVVMAILYIAKMRVATRMQSHALRAEAMESLFCDLQDVSILIGLGLNALFSWWWADPVSALILVPFFIKEGLGNLSGGCHHDNPNSPQVCFCYRLHLRPPPLPRPLLPPLKPGTCPTSPSIHSPQHNNHRLISAIFAHKIPNRRTTLDCFIFVIISWYFYHCLRLHRWATNQLSSIIGQRAGTAGQYADYGIVGDSTIHLRRNTNRG